MKKQGAFFYLLALAVGLICCSAWSVNLPMSYDFENANDSCWAARPNGDENSNGCNNPLPALGFTNVGKGSAARPLLTTGTYGHAYNGVKSARIKLDTNEDEARFRWNVNNRHIFIQQYMYYDTAYDFAFGEKIIRAAAIDSITFGQPYFDNICYTRCFDPPTPGRDSNQYFTCEPNGGSGYFVSFTLPITRGVWHRLQVEFYLNDADSSNGICRVWWDGTLMAEVTDLSNMRTSSKPDYNPATDTHVYSSIIYGGWYSNGSGGDPNVPAIKYMDDVAADTSFIPASGGSSRWGVFGDNDIFLLKAGF